MQSYIFSQKWKKNARLGFDTARKDGFLPKPLVKGKFHELSSLTL